MMRSINSTRMTTISTTPRPQFTTPRLHGLTIQFPCHHSNATSTHNRSSIKARVSIKIKDYDNLGDFELDSTQLDTLTQLLSLPSFCKEVRTNAGPSKVEGTPEFTGMLFQPVPWSATTRKGMPQNMEQYYDSKNHVIINVPPTFMFKAKVFKPPRLCAVYEISSIDT